MKTIIIAFGILLMNTMTLSAQDIKKEDTITKITTTD